MNRSGTSAIILIYLMTTLPVFMDRRSHQADAKTDLYSTFQDRLNATSNFAKSEYDTKTSGAVNKIYDLAGKILFEQLKQQQQQPPTDSQNGNYADKLVDEANPSHFHNIPPPAVASTVANTNAGVAKKNPELINAQVVGSDVEQLDHRQARKTRKASRRFCPRPHRTKKSYSEASTAKGQSSRPKWENRRMRPSSLSSFSTPVDGGDGMEWQLSPISTQSKARQSATSSVAVVEQPENIDDDWHWRRSSNSKGSLNNNDADSISGSEMHGSTKSIDGGNGSNWHGLSSDKWRRKLQINGKRKNLLNCRSWPSLSEEQLNELIESDEEELGEAKDENQPRRSRPLTDEYTRTRINTRSVDSFPEVFSRPLVDSSSLPVGGAVSELNEALKNANSLLTSVPNIAVSSSLSKSDNAGPRIGKQVQPFDLSPIEGAIAGDILSHKPDATNAENLTNVMEKVLGELESLKECKQRDSVQPEGSPCDVIGSWNSETIGLQFHISLADPSPSSRTFVEGKKIEIDLTERVPPKRHDLMDCDWYLTGSIVKQFGGPFYITAQKTERYIVATFAGLCKTCGGIPTIFGSWTFVYPAKDCQDISLAVENKRDVLRKDTMEIKRKHRLVKLGASDKGKCLKCSHTQR